MLYNGLLLIFGVGDYAGSLQGKTPKMIPKIVQGFGGVLPFVRKYSSVEIMHAEQDWRFYRPRLVKGGPSVLTYGKMRHPDNIVRFQVMPSF